MRRSSLLLALVGVTLASACYGQSSPPVLKIQDGGTGANNVPAARANLGAAASGAPATVTLSVTGGAVTAASVDVPGLYQTNPGSPLAPFDPKVSAAYNASLNVTYGGASSGAYVDAAFGAVIDDQANGGSIENVTVSEAPVGLEVLASSTTTTQETVSGFSVNGAPLVGFAKLSGVNNVNLDKITVSGFAHHASAYGATGLYVEGDSRAYANGGSTYNFRALGFESGMLDINGQLDQILYGTVDTNRNYGVVCIGCAVTDFSYLFSAFTGPNALGPLGSIAGKGVGSYFGSSASNPAVNNSIAKFSSSVNASDIHFGDPAGSVKVGSPWGPSKIMTASNASSVELYSTTALITIPTLSVGGLTSPQYLAPGAVSATQTVSALAGIHGQITGAFVTSSIAPGADTYSAFLYVNVWNGSAYLGWNAVGSCTWTGATYACTVNNSGAAVNPQDQVGLAIATSGATFVASQTISAQVVGQ